MEEKIGPGVIQPQQNVVNNLYGLLKSGGKFADIKTARKKSIKTLARKYHL